MRRKLILAVLVLLTFLLQSTVFKALSIASITPNLLLILTVSFGFMCGKRIGMFTGFLSGLMIDMFYGNLFGFHALLYMWIGFLNGFLYKVYYDEDIKVPTMLVTASDAVYGIVIYGLQFMLRGRLNFFGYLKQIIIPEIVYTVVMTLLFYRLFLWINRQLLEYEMEGQRSPWLRR
ncbi:rod shape-determining protein MreD [Lawsonibacter sp. OA9]|uniref:rod shape-determining protein MreD n=1 Tax=Oscillospiraceae TaxID=216572 RepID=UPI001F063EE1|nr:MULTISPECIES: rod shape-determining protein MreD [Oscillospiraceae]MCH1978251.1 rod shape-determining protein MreD [Lawsonibacter sp. OA9]MCH1983318.1 rod shape-determining protein MreD [Ruminococcus sp. OA3]